MGKTVDEVIVYVPMQQDADTLIQFKIKEDIPLFLLKEDEEMLKAAGSTIKNTTQSLFWIYLFLAIFFSFALSMLWGTFQTL